MIFIVWSDYDNRTVERIDRGDYELNIKRAEEICAKIKAREEDDSYGTRLHAVIEGEELIIDHVERISIIKLSKK